MSINIVKKTSTINTTYEKGRAIKYIVIHYTAGVTSKSGSAANVAGYFANTNVGASADFIVDDSNIVQYNPDIKNRYCWSVGGSNWGNKGGKLYGVATNRNCINIEICSTNSTGRITNANDKYFSFTDAVVNNALELTKYLMQQYGIDADHVIRHYDVNGKTCPGIIGWNAESGSEAKWNAFKAKLKSSATTTATSATATAKTVSYTVKVPAALTIFAGAGTNYKVTGKCPVGVYTIVAESSGTGAKLFGKLKSGAGWIVLDHCTKVSTTAKKTIDELAREVIQGKWGNGAERKQKLTAAGYDYDKVQARVNELLK